MESRRVGHRSQHGDHPRRAGTHRRCVDPDQCDGVDVVLKVTGTVAGAPRVVLEAVRESQARGDGQCRTRFADRPDSEGEGRSSRGRGDEHRWGRARCRHDAAALTPNAWASSRCGRQYQGHGRLLPQSRYAAGVCREERPGRQEGDVVCGSTKLSMETTVLANATGFHAGRRGMYGPACRTFGRSADAPGGRDARRQVWSTMRWALRLTRGPSSSSMRTRH